MRRDTHAGRAPHPDPQQHRPVDLQRVRRPVGRPRVLEELEVRDVLQGLFDIRRQANADTVAPYIAALSAVRLGLTPPDAVEEAMPDAPGLA